MRKGRRIKLKNRRKLAKKPNPEQVWSEDCSQCGGLAMSLTSEQVEMLIDDDQIKESENKARQMSENGTTQLYFTFCTNCQRIAEVILTTAEK